MTTELVVPPESTPGVAVPFREDEVVLDGRDVYTGTTAIQDALDDATSGGHIAIGPGSWDNALTVSTANITLTGAGLSTTIAHSGDGNDNPTISIEADGIVVESVEITHSGTDDCIDFTSGTSNAIVRTTKLDCSGESCIDGNGTDHAVLNNLFVRTGNPAVRITGNRVLVQGNTFNVDPNAITDNMIRSGTDCAIVGNIINDAALDGIDTGSGGGNAVVGNRIRNATEDGIELSGPDDIAVGNVISGSGTHGIEATGSGTDALITGNRVVNPSSDGINTSVNRTVITGNHVNSAGDDGIVTTATDTILAGNHVTGSTNQNIDLSSATTPVAEGNIPPAAGTGSWDNPEVIDLNGSNSTLSASGHQRDVYVVQVENTGASAANLQGVSGVAQQGTFLAVTAKNVTNSIDLAHNAGTSNDFLNTSAANVTLDAADETVMYVCDDTDWREMGVNQQ